MALAESSCCWWCREWLNLVLCSDGVGAPRTASSSTLAFTDCKKFVMLRVPLVSDLRLAFTCLMRPRDGVAYVAARIFHASRVVVARIVGAVEFYRSLSCNINDNKGCVWGITHGFLDRTKERGLVLKSWALQVAVLNHPSVGGFVSHCGWNSVLKAVCAGVPLVAWPLYAEQRINRIFLVEEMKLALPMNESDNGFVSSAEVEERVLGLMESEEGKLIRERTIAMKIAAKAAFNEGGSSQVALSKIVESWKDK
ncbi:hypothetical protein POTOM_015323 [Populus tomentosa]|uniref:anthocyanidin 3-O-glucosyltransferase n=1 Tax=Populus tomentosa TaxID=118781 RepID=A0A8X8ADB2_POPTO|nr:hypothetical protein POTOM_015323 [Populus tomentosa]